MKPVGLSFATRLFLALAVLLLAYGAWVGLVGRQLAAEQAQVSLQRVSHGLARHIVGHWPEITVPDRDEADRAARQALLGMLMTVNPGVQVYLLDADGRVQHYIGEPGMVRQHQVDLVAVRAFLAGAELPLRGTDPMGSPEPRVFSAAMFPPRAGDTRPPGYLYIVLDSPARGADAAALAPERLWRGAALAAGAGLLLPLGVGLFTMRRLSRPLHRLARRLHGYHRQAPAPAVAPLVAQAAPVTGAAPVLPATMPNRLGGDEVQAIEAAFEGMTQRIEAQAEHVHRQASDHREMMASVAHDLRSPLTALHGQLEMLAQDGLAEPGRREAVLHAALAQSRQISRLSQQLFELATLQSTEQVLHRERFSLDELVSDAVQKFSAGTAQPSVLLSGPPPGNLALEGDLQLLERALTNLIDNALRRAPGVAPVRISLRQANGQAEVLVEDGGPGLPDELYQRLAEGRPLRDPPVRRSSGGLGGLGLAIAQRVAVLHGGSLRPLPAPEGGARLSLCLPLAA